MSTAPRTWNLDCPWCSFYIVAAQRAGAGEEAAAMMTDHLDARHSGKTWTDFLAAKSGRVEDSA